jgi:hypothetical protein
MAKLSGFVLRKRGGYFSASNLDRCVEKAEQYTDPATCHHRRHRCRRHNYHHYLFLRLYFHLYFHFYLSNHAMFVAN